MYLYFFRIWTAVQLALTLDNVKIKNASYMKYLGDLLDNNLWFKPQIAHCESKTLRFVGVIAKLRYLSSHTISYLSELVFRLSSFTFAIWIACLGVYI